MDLIGNIARTFGSFRAENLGDQVFSLYTKPAYFPKLLTPIPCILQGGRGTGKTTVLKSLSYQGQFKLAGDNLSAFDKIDYIGLYYKLETALVNAFSGAGQNDEFWQKFFSHFINLQLCKQLCDFAIWYQATKKIRLNISIEALNTFCTSLGLDDQHDLETLQSSLDLAIAKLEVDINSASDTTNQKQTPVGAPIRRLIKVLRSTKEFENKTFYFVFDEYENLHSYQQVVLNTFIKQADSELTFKIGIKELGLKTKKTLNPNEQLVDPADYVLIDISTSLSDVEFEEFTKNVIRNRFEDLRIREKDVIVPTNIDDIFEELSEDDEAVKLGAKEIVEDVTKLLSQRLSKKELAELKQMKEREVVLMKFVVDSSKGSKDIYDVFKEAMSDPGGWRNKINNYGYASLFTIRKKKVGTSKYYSGWKTLLALSANNIRYFLQLVTNSLIEHVKDKKTFAQKISAQTQTDVAAKVGEKNLLELEGLSTRGAQLMKLVLGIGQVFHQMAIQPEGHAPEINQFEVSSKSQSQDEIVIQVNELLHTAVMHLALIRTSGTKLGSPGDTRDFDYMLHPIFSAFFIYSHRRKRKLTLIPEDILGIISNPSNTIRAILIKQNRSGNIDLPEQLQLFGGFYDRNQ